MNARRAKGARESAAFAVYTGWLALGVGCAAGADDSRGFGLGGAYLGGSIAQAASSAIGAGGGSLGFAGTTNVGGSIGSGASSSAGAGAASSGESGLPIEPCLLEASNVATPIFQDQIVEHDACARRELFLYVTEAEAAALRAERVLLGPELAQEPAHYAHYALEEIGLESTALRQQLAAELGAAFSQLRPAWPNPWALRLAAVDAAERSVAVRVVLRPQAWIARLVHRALTVVDLDNVVVGVEQALAEPERIAALYFVKDNELGTSCAMGYRELLLGRESMIEEWSLGTPEILERQAADLSRLQAFMRAARPCVRGDGPDRFHEATVCSTWRRPPTPREGDAYAFALAAPSEPYFPEAATLALLIETLEKGLFETDPLIVAPPF